MIAMATTKTAAKSATKTAADTMSELMKQKDFKALLSSMVAESSAAVSADLAAELAAEKAQLKADREALELHRAEMAKPEADQKSASDMMAEIKAIQDELAAEKAKAVKAVKAAKKAAKKADPICYVPQDIKRDRATGDALTGKRAGVWPAKFGITPDKFSDKRPTWVNAEIVRTILDNLVDARAVLKQCDSANAAE